MAEFTSGRRAKLRITPRQIVELLQLPEGSTVMAVRGSFDPVGIEVVVSHPNLAEVPDDAEAPFLTGAAVKVERCADGAHVRRQVTWGF